MLRGRKHYFRWGKEEALDALSSTFGLSGTKIRELYVDEHLINPNHT